MPDLPEVREKFVADTTGYSRPLREAAKDADKFSRQNDQAALAARKMGLAAKDAADKAARAQRAAADAAEKLARGELKADEAAQAAARAERELERASIKAAEAQRATAHAADQAADNFRQVARDAALAAAAENLAALRAAGATKQHGAELEKLRKQFPEIAKDATGAFSEMGVAATRSGEQVAGSAKIWGPAILVGIQALPFAAAAAGGAISLALGGALSGIGLLAQAKTADVKQSFSGLKTHVVGELKQISAPFHSTLLQISADARATFDSLAPWLANAFSKMAPAISGFSTDFTQSLAKLQPMIFSIGNAFSRTLADLGSRMPAIMNNLGTSIKAITDAVAANPAAFGQFVQGLTMIVRVVGDGIGLLIRFSSQIQTAAQVANAVALGPLGDLALGALKVKNAFSETNSGLQVVERTFPSFSAQAIASAAATGQLMTAQQAATLSSKQLKSALDALTGANQNAFDATTGYRHALLAANAQAKASNAGIDGMSKAALANRQALSSLSAAIKNVMQNAHPTSAAIEGMRQKFIAAAVQMNVSRGEAQRLADQLLGVKGAADKIPKSKQTKVSAPGATNATAQANALRNAINSIPGTRTIDIHYTVHSREMTKAKGGLVAMAAGGRVAFPAGGRVSGPGSGTSDSVPAMLSNGEFVVNASATAQNLSLLQAINRGVAGFASGGIPKGVQAGGNARRVPDYPAGVRGISPRQLEELYAADRLKLAKARPEYLAAMAAQQSLQRMRNSIYGGLFRGGRPEPGSAHGTVVQHTTVIHVTVQGNVWKTQELARELQGVLAANRMPVTMPRGR